MGLPTNGPKHILGLPVPTGEFPGGPASFVMRRFGGSVDFFLNLHTV